MTASTPNVGFVTGLSDVTLLDNHCVPSSRNSTKFVTLWFHPIHISGSLKMKTVYDQFVYMRFKSLSSTITFANMKDGTGNSEKRRQIYNSHHFNLQVKCLQIRSIVSSENLVWNVYNHIYLTANNIEIWIFVNLKLRFSLKYTRGQYSIPL